MNAAHTPPLAEIRTAACALTFDPGAGNLRRLVLRDGERRIEPLHAAPWLDEPPSRLPPDLPPVERRLSGDFFCAPFGPSDVEPAPPHGWAANDCWELVRASGGLIEARLFRRTMGATIRKRLALSEDAPLLLQEHFVSGGDGGLTVAHHPMFRLEGRGRLSCSPKRAALTPETPLEPGRERLACPARSADLARFPGSDGSEVDLTDLPIGSAHEDFVTLVEEPGSALGWTALLREAEDDVAFVLKDSAVLPVTMLWHSNGGRDRAPWSGRHRGVLGIEDGCAAGAAGHAAALEPNPVSDEGAATALALEPGTEHRVAHAIGALARPEGWTRVADIRLEGDRLILIGDGGAPRELPFPADFFETRN